VAYRFEPDESVREALARCAREQLDHAVQELSEEIKNDPVGAVHEARKEVKKERALLRLARGTLAGKQRARENAALREAARGLSDARDAEVMIQTLNELSERFTGQLPKSTFGAIRKQLVQTRRAERARVVKSDLSAEAAEDLGEVRMRIDDWKFNHGGWRAIDGGLRRSYGRGRRAFRRARAEPSLENLHAWRKRVKDLWYQLRLVAPVCGPAVRGQAKEAHRLADLLGDDHDLGVLSEILVRMRFEVAVDLDALLGLVDYRREQLQTEAMYVAERVYAEKTKAFGRRLHSCWNAGRAKSRASNEHRPVELAEVTRLVNAA
jgi:CHAD domain-containing protein